MVLTRMARSVYSLARLVASPRAASDSVRGVVAPGEEGSPEWLPWGNADERGDAEVER